MIQRVRSLRQELEKQLPEEEQQELARCHDSTMQSRARIEKMPALIDRVKRLRDELGEQVQGEEKQVQEVVARLRKERMLRLCSK